VKSWCINSTFLITHISSIYHPHIIHISHTYRPNITQSIFFTTPQLDKKSSFYPDMARLLQEKTPLWNSIKTPLLIIQILPKYHQNIIQKSSRNHPEIIQKSSRNNPEIIQSTSIFKTPLPPQLGEKSSFHPVMARLLQVNSPLLNSIKTPLLESKSRVLLDFNSSFCLLGATIYFLIYSFYHIFLQYILSFSTVFVMLQNICSLNVQISV